MEDRDKQRLIDEIKMMYDEVKDDLTTDEARQLLDALAPAIRRIAERN